MNRYLYYLDENKFGYEDDKEKSEREDVIASGEEFVLTVIAKQVDGVKERVEALQQKYPNAKIEMDLSFERDYIYEESEMKLLEDVDKFCSTKDIKLYISLSNLVGGEYQNILMARNQIEELKQKVNNFTYEENGKQVKLSTYEKFLIVYKFVANRVYNMDENYNNNAMRNWVGVLTSDKVICSGFASLLKCVCDQVFDADELKCYEQSCYIYDEKGQELGGHANNLVMINDPKYGLNGLYHADTCWDCKSEERGNKTTFDYCLIPIQQIVQHKGANFDFDSDLFVYKDINPYYNIKRGGRGINENSLANDLLVKFGFKSSQQLLDEANIDGVIEQKEKEHDDKLAQVRENNEKLKETIDNKLREFFDKVGFKSLDEVKVMTLYPKNFAEKHPELAEALNFFNNIEMLEDLDNPKVIEQAKKYKQMYEGNIEQFEEFKKIWLEKTKDMKIFKPKEVSLFEDIAENIFYKNKEHEDIFGFDEYKEKKRLEEEVEQQINQQIDECLQVGKDFIYSQPIDDKKFAKGLVAMAKYVGLEESKIEDWVKEEVEKRREFTLNSFGEKEIIFPEEKKNDNPFEF